MDKTIGRNAKQKGMEMEFRPKKKSESLKKKNKTMEQN